MNHIGLFEGIGGFSLAAKWMGWETIAWCEINPFGQQVLNYHFHQTGKTSQLNPRFVAEMMGFPPDWLELPFINTDKNQ